MSGYRILYGDIHNHNAHGYGVGSIERSLEIARTHLDFFAFTGHSSWHDMPAMEGERERHWIEGFKRLKDTWPRVQQVIADGNRDGEFCAFLGFEWHSSHWGDQCVVFPRRPPAALLRRRSGAPAALLQRGARADDPAPPRLSAGPARRELGGVPRGLHAGGGDLLRARQLARTTADRIPSSRTRWAGARPRNTARAALEAGLRFGFVGSSDDHAGFPGAYGEGLMAALVDDFTRAGHLRGDPRAAHVRAHRRPHRGRLHASRARRWARPSPPAGAPRRVFAVRGRDELDVVEIIQDGRVVHRAFADGRSNGERGSRTPVQVRLEWGWGPWGALALDRICDWAMQVDGGRTAASRASFPACSRCRSTSSAAIASSGRARRGLAIRSYTVAPATPTARTRTRASCWRSKAAQTRCSSSRLSEPVAEPQPVDARAICSRGSREPLHRRRSRRRATSGTGSCRCAASSLEGRCTLDVPAGRSHVYLRARQKNGHMAWASPVFMNWR